MENYDYDEKGSRFHIFHLALNPLAYFIFFLYRSYPKLRKVELMELRSRINTAMKQAMKDKSTERLSTIRLINAAIKDRDIAARTEGKENGVGDDEVLAILAKMTKQRQESAKTYEEAGRLDLSERELAEITVIEEFLPKQLTESEIKSAVSEAITEVEANSIRDMGKVMGLLKSKYAGQMDFGAVGARVKNSLTS